MNEVLHSLTQLLAHVKQVESEMITLSADSVNTFSDLVNKHQIPLDDRAIEAMQFQDIVTQQLGATIEAMEAFEMALGHIQTLECGKDETIQNVLAQTQSSMETALADAKDKSDRFSGKLHHANEDIEFF